MSSRQPSNNNETSSGRDRPTLPPIHMLFGPELARPPRPSPHGGVAYSPSAHLSQLNVSDDRTPHGNDPARPDNMYPLSRAQGLPGPPPPLPLPQASRSPYTMGHPTARPHTPSLSFDGGAYGRPRHGESVERPRSTSNPPYFVHSPYGVDRGLDQYPPQAAYPSQYETQRGEPSHQSYSSGHRMRATGMVQPVASSASYPFGVPQDTRTEIALPSGTNEGPVSTASRYECPWPDCRKGFTRPSSLRIHVYSHTGERPFKCTFEGCDRAFSVQSNMRRHARTHTQPAAPDVQETSEDDESEGSSTRESSRGHA